MKYDDDQCERCGGARVAKSTLCADCLVKERAFLDKEILIKKAVIEEKETRIFNLLSLLKEAINYGFKKNRENTRLHQHLLQRAQIIEREKKDEKDRVHENK